MAKLWSFLSKSHEEEAPRPVERKPRSIGDWSDYEDLDSESTFDRDRYESSHSVESVKPHKLFYHVAIGTSAFAVLILVVGVLAVYMMGLVHYTFHFYPHSYINGIDVSDNTSSEAQKKIRGDFDDYVLTVHLREKDLQFTAKDMGLKVTLEPGANSLMHQQDAFRWMFEMWEQHDYTSEVKTSYDDMTAKMSIGSALTETKENNEGYDAHLTEESDGTLTYVPGMSSTFRDDAFVRESILSAILTMEPELDMRNTAAYSDPFTMESDKRLQALADMWNACITTDLTYNIDGSTHTLTGSSVRGFIRFTEDGLGLELGRAFLISLIREWYDLDTVMNSPVYRYDVEISQEIKQQMYDAYLLKASDKMFSDIVSHSTDGTLPWFSTEVDGLTAGWAMSIDVGEKAIIMYYDGQEKACFDVTFGGYTNWSNAKSAILSYSSPRSGVLALSNGLLIGLDASSMDICCPEMHELVDFMKGKVIGYTMMIAEGSNEEAAWHNQVPSGHSVSGKDYSQDWLAFPIGEN